MLYSRLTDSEIFSSATNKQLKIYAMDGLRTLCVAERIISTIDYEVGVCITPFCSIGISISLSLSLLGVGEGVLCCKYSSRER